MECIFIFGRDPELSFLELTAYLEARSIAHRLLSWSNVAAVFDLPELDFGKMIRELGGTVKIAKVIEPTEELYLGKENKVKFAISDYGSHLDHDVRDIVKEQMKEARLKAAIKGSKRGIPYLSPSEVNRYGLVDPEQGFELVLYKNYVGKTVAVFDPEEHEKRDLQRPMQRFEQMISIRLAKIMANLVGARGKTLLDPFCGYGILLQEAMMIGMNVIGVDIDKRCVDASIRNLQWTKKRYNLQGWFKVVNGDSTKLSSFIKSADCAATEPNLGPVLKKKPSKAEAVATIKKIVPVYSLVLQEMKKVVKGRAAIIVPRFRTDKGEKIGFDFGAMCRDAGFKAVSIARGVSNPVVYSYPGSLMEREIWVLENEAEGK